MPETAVAEEQVSAPAPETTEPDSPSTETPDVSPSPEERGSRWLNRALRRGLREARSQPAEKEDTERSEEKAKADESADEAVTLSRSELERRIQSEADKRFARAQKASTTAASPTPATTDESDTPPAPSLNDLTTQTTRTAFDTYDRAVLDPLYKEVGDEAGAKILAKHAKLDAVAQRAAVAKDFLAEIRSQAEAKGAADAEAKLRKNPAFRKQIAADLRGGAEEPDVIPAAGRAAVSPSMNDFIRRAAHGGRFASVP